MKYIIIVKSFPNFDAVLGSFGDYPSFDAALKVAGVLNAMKENVGVRHFFPIEHVEFCLLAEWRKTQ